jgi:hypothetical protein
MGVVLLEDTVAAAHGDCARGWRSAGA